MSSKRQKNGTGTVSTRKDGTVEYKVSLGIGMDGKPLRKSFYGKTEKIAIDKYKLWLKNSDNITIERVKTVGEWADKWLELYKKDKVDYITYSDYKGYVNNHVSPKLGHLKIEQVRPAHIQQFFSKARKRNKKGDELPNTFLSNSAQQKLKIILNGIFETAIENRFCTVNPVKNITFQKQAKQEVEIFRENEIKKIIEYIPKHEYGCYIALMLYSGLRIGELLALKWNDIDLINSLITVREALIHTETGEAIGNTTKGKKSRVVPINQSVLEVISNMPKTSLFVVPNSLGSHHTHSSFDTIYSKFFCDLNKTLKDNEKVRKLTPHKCRHSFAAYSVKSGIDIRILQKLLGHAQITTTEIYAHVDTTDLTNNIKKLSFSK